MGTLEPGKHADFLFVNGDPLTNVGVLLKPGAIAAVYRDGRRLQLEPRAYDPYRTTAFNTLKWTELYTRDHVERLGLTPQCMQ